MSFALDLSRMVEKAKGKTDIAVKKVMLDLFTKVVEKSPVDTGRFRANWQVGYGAANLTTTLETDKSGRIAIGAIAAKVAASKLDGRSMFLTNSLPYSIKLEHGHSKQSPAGMVRLSLIEVTAQYGR